MTASTPPIPVTGALPEVQSQFDRAHSFGSTAFSSALGLIGQLSSFDPTGVSFDTSFTVPGSLISGFMRPDRPADPDDVEFDVTVPDPPAFSAISIPTFSSVPTFDKDAPLVDFSGKPQPFAKLPPEVPALFPVTIPTAPNIALPELPSLQELQLPDPPDVLTPEFTAERPTFNTPVPDASLNYSFTPYSEVLLSQVQQEISRILTTGLGLPPAIEQALFDRATGREDAAANRAVDEVFTEFAARGFTLPNGLMDRRVKEVRRQNAENRSATNRELAINATQVQIESLRFAVQQGIAAESLTAQIHFQAEELQLQAAQIVSDFVLRIFLARVEVYNAEVAAFRVDAEVFRSLIEAELSKVEVYRAQIQAELARGEINQQKINLYVARLEGLNTLVAIYRGQVEAANTVAATNATIIQGFGAEVDAYRSEVQAKESEFAAWAQQIQGELGKVEAYRAEVGAFTARVQAYAAGVDAQAIAPRLQLEQQTVLADQYRAQISGVQAQIAALASRADAVASIFSSKAAIYSAEGQVSVAEAESNTRQFLAVLEEARARSTAMLAEAELNVNQAIAIGNQVVEALRGAAQAASQLAASALSSVNASASIGESGSATNSWAFSEEWRKDIT